MLLLRALRPGYDHALDSGGVEFVIGGGGEYVIGAYR